MAWRWRWRSRQRWRWVLGAVAAVLVLAVAPIILSVIANRVDRELPEWLAGWFTWPRLLGLVVLVGLASWGLTGRPAHERARRRPMIAAIDDIDPLAVGVAAATQNIVVGGNLPTYQSRDVDPQLDEAVAAAVSGRGDWVVVIEGDTAVGKTRTLFEALRRCATSVDPNRPATHLTLIAGDPRDDLRELLSTDPALLSVDGPAVLWLDDLEDFLPNVTFGDLDRWHKAGKNRIVAATIGGKGSVDVLSAGIAEDIRRRARVIRMVPTREAEVEALRDSVSDSEWQMMVSKGLAEYFVGVEPLKTKLNTAQHPGETSKCYEGRAVVYAAIDWRRCGRTDPIPKRQLRELYTAYLPSGVASAKGAFRTALRWATRPLTPHWVLLAGNADDGYRADDAVLEERSELEPRAAAWTMALTTLPSVDAGLAVGLAATHHERWNVAIEAFRRAEQATNPQIASAAKTNLACAQRNVKRLGDALRTTQDTAFDRWSTSADPILRERAAEALYQQVLVRSELSDLAGAVNSLQRIVDAYGGDDDGGVRARAAQALGAHSQLAAAMSSGRAGVREAWQLVVDRYADDPAWQVREQVAKTLWNSAIEADRYTGPSIPNAKVYGEIITRYGTETHPALRTQVAMALVNRAAELHALRRDDEAATDIERVIDDYADDVELEIRQQVLRATLIRGIFLMDVDSKPHEALVEFQHIIDRYSSDPSPVMREGVARATVRKAIALSAIPGREREALRIYRLVVERHESKNTPNYRRVVAQARLNMSHLLPPSEALEMYGRIDERYHSDPEPLIREIVAKALNCRGKKQLSNDARAAYASHERVVELYGRDPITQLSELGTRAKMGVQVAEALCAMGDISTAAADDAAERGDTSSAHDQRANARAAYQAVGTYRDVEDDELQHWVAYADNCLQSQADE